MGKISGDLFLCRENGILFIQINQLYVVIGIEQRLVVVLSMNIGKLFAQQVQMVEGDDFTVDSAEIFSCSRNFSGNDVFLAPVGSPLHSLRPLQNKNNTFL